MSMAELGGTGELKHSTPAITDPGAEAANRLRNARAMRDGCNNGRDFARGGSDSGSGSLDSGRQGYEEDPRKIEAQAAKISSDVDYYSRIGDKGRLAAAQQAANDFRERTGYTVNQYLGQESSGSPAEAAKSRIQAEQGRNSRADINPNNFQGRGDTAPKPTTGSAYLDSLSRERLEETRRAYDAVNPKGAKEHQRLTGVGRTNGDPNPREAGVYANHGWRQFDTQAVARELGMQKGFFESKGHFEQRVQSAYNDALEQQRNQVKADNPDTSSSSSSASGADSAQAAHDAWNEKFLDRDW